MCACPSVSVLETCMCVEKVMDNEQELRAGRSEWDRETQRGREVERLRCSGINHRSTVSQMKDKKCLLQLMGHRLKEPD